MYLLDTNVFIEAKNRYYDLDFCPAFWDCLRQLHNKAKVFSIDKVKDEIEIGDDDLSIWIKKLNKSFFIITDADAAKQFGKINDWLYQENYETAATQSFIQDADYYLIARALTNTETIIVTQEIANEGKKKVKIPNICIGLGIKYLSTFQMLKKEKTKFILKNT